MTASGDRTATGNGREAAPPTSARAAGPKRKRAPKAAPAASNPGFTIITGLSGAGRSEAARCLEDLGYFVVDNLPPTLLAKMAELASAPGGPGRVAIVLDVRGGVFFGELSKALEELRELEVPSRILFLEASDQDLVNRYESTRRRHPLAPDDRVVEGIRKERLMMESLRGDADLIIDTSGLTPHGLRDKIRDAFADTAPGESLQVSLIAFGYKYGSPRDADLVIDCRFLPKPALDRRTAPAPRNRRARPDLRPRTADLPGVPPPTALAARLHGAGVRRGGEVVPDDRGGMHRGPPPLGRRRGRPRNLLPRQGIGGFGRPPRPRPLKPDGPEREEPSPRFAGRSID